MTYHVSSAMEIRFELGDDIFENECFPQLEKMLTKTL